MASATAHTASSVAPQLPSALSSSPIPFSCRVAARRAHELSITALRWSPDGTLLATASADRTVRLWRGDSCTLMGTL